MFYINLCKKKKKTPCSHEIFILRSFPPFNTSDRSQSQILSRTIFPRWFSLSASDFQHQLWQRKREGCRAISPSGRFQDQYMFRLWEPHSFVLNKNNLNETKNIVKGFFFCFYWRICTNMLPSSWHGFPRKASFLSTGCLRAGAHSCTILSQPFKNSNKGTADTDSWEHLLK